MSQSDRAIKKLATDLARIRAEVKSWRGAQADFTSIENGGNFTFKDGDGNVTAIMGGQDDGSNTIRHVDGPTPPVPSGLSAHADGPIVQVSWDGSFEDADEATYDWSHLEVIAVGPDNTNLRATINDVTGATANLAATASGEWTVVARSVSRAEKRSLDGDAGTVEVKLVDIDGAIEAVQDSANGKNQVHYSSTAPTPADPGIKDDTWFVGEVGRPNDVVEATNLMRDPSFELGVSEFTISAGTLTSETTERGRIAVMSGNGGSSTWMSQTAAAYPLAAGKWVAASLWANSNGQVRYRWATYGGSTQYVLSDYVSANDERVSHSFQIPAGQSSFLFTFQATPGSTGTRTEVDDVVIATADSKAAAEAKVATYFDGDTESGATDNEPHYRWTGTPHASTSEKYLPALNIGDSDNWNVIEQYRHDGTGWVKVELSHHVFSTVDLGKATVGELDGIRIMGQTIHGEQLSGDAIDGKVITGGTYRTTDGTGQWSDAGLFIAKPDGTSMVRFPTDGSPLSLTASDTQIERASIGELDVTNGAIRSGGQFTLASGVTAPPSPPELATGWQKVTTLEKPDTSERYDWTGLASWGDKWVRTINVIGERSADLDSIVVYNEDGTIEDSFVIDNNPRHGVAVIGDIAYVLGPDRVPRPGVEKNWMHGFDLNTGERVSRWEFTRFVGGKNRLGVGTDGTNLLVAGAHLDVSRRLYVMRYNPATGVQVGADIVSDEWVSYTKNVEGVHISGNSMWVSHVEAAREFSLSGSTPTYTNNGWVNPNKNGAGMTFVDGAPLVVDSGAVYRGSTSASDYTREVCFTWYDGTHETTASPVASVDVGARETVTISLPVRAGLQKRLYSRSAGVSNWSRSVVPADVTVSPVPVGIAAFTPPSTNTFPNAAPAVLKSTNDKFEVNGDGSGHWGPLTFNADGTMTSTAIPAWIPVTSFLNGAGANSFGYAPAYRIWPDGKVEWRGIVSFPGTLDTSGEAELIDIPTVARPAQFVFLFGATNTGGGPRGARIDFSPAGKFRVSSSGTVSWVSLDGISYYLT